jgi:5-methyltetrahydropteroyltriglutamate--homocysteine methyltransferase
VHVDRYDRVQIHGPDASQVACDSQWLRERRRRTAPTTSAACRGNFRSSWVAEGGYDHVAEALFNGLEVDGFFMGWDDERSGGFAALRFLPPGKQVVLGLVTTKRGELESKDELKRRIEEAARYAPLDQLCLSPQCGFSSTVDGNALTIDEEIAKLRLVAETAEEVWG